MRTNGCEPAAHKMVRAERETEREQVARGQLCLARLASAGCEPVVHKMVRALRKAERGRLDSARQASAACERLVRGLLCSAR